MQSGYFCGTEFRAGSGQKFSPGRSRSDRRGGSAISCRTLAPASLGVPQPHRLVRAQPTANQAPSGVGPRARGPSPLDVEVRDLLVAVRVPHADRPVVGRRQAPPPVPRRGDRHEPRDPVGRRQPAGEFALLQVPHPHDRVAAVGTRQSEQRPSGQSQQAREPVTAFRELQPVRLARLSRWRRPTPAGSFEFWAAPNDQRPVLGENDVLGRAVRAGGASRPGPVGSGRAAAGPGSAAFSRRDRRAGVADHRNAPSGRRTATSKKPPEPSSSPPTRPASWCPRPHADPEATCRSRCPGRTGRHG